PLAAPLFPYTTLFRSRSSYAVHPGRTRGLRVRSFCLTPHRPVSARYAPVAGRRRTYVVRRHALSESLCVPCPARTANESADDHVGRRRRSGAADLRDGRRATVDRRRAVAHRLSLSAGSGSLRPPRRRQAEEGCPR